MKTLEMTKNLFIPNARVYFDFLTKGFVLKEEIDGKLIYSVTRKGDKFLKRYKVINRFVDSFRL